jgi:nitrous oxide reductase accessory protein NosL
MACGCGKRVRIPGAQRTATDDPSKHVDPTRALFAAAMPRLTVIPAGGGKGKTFSTQSAAEDYARRTGGKVVPG